MKPPYAIHPERRDRGVSASFALLGLAAIAAAVVFVTRVTSWQNCWRWSIAEGAEGQSIYAIWRVVHGMPLYTWPNEEPYSLTYLNFGFYWTYGAIARAVNARGEELLWVARLVTVLGSVVGSVLFVSTAKLVAAPRTRLEWLGLWALAFVLWFGTQFIAWWVLSIRPDVWAAAFALGGMRLALPALATRSVGRLVAASVLFWLAWSFKQSCILTFVGCILSALLVVRNWRGFVALLAPFGVLVATSLWVGGEVYRFSILTVPGASRLRLGLMTEVLLRAIPQNPWVFGFFPLVLAFGWAHRRRPSWRELPITVRALAVIVLVSVVLGTVALGREGSNKNHLFEGYIASALASYWGLMRVKQSENGTRWLPVLGVLSLVPLAAFPILQIAMPGRLGRTVLCSEKDAAELQTLAGEVGRLPKPLYTDHEIFSLPWHSSDGRHPAVVVDGLLYAIAKREALVAADFPQRLLAPPRFRAVVQLEGHPDLSALRARGSECRALPGRPFGLGYVACLPPAVPR
jgi:hypothetical protein